MLKGSKYPAYKTTIKFVFIAIFEKKLRQNNKEHHLLSWLWHPYKKKQQREHPPRMALVVATNTLKLVALGAFTYPISALRVPSL